MTTLALGLFETVVFSGKAATLVSTIGTDLIIGTITSTTSSIGGMIKYLTINNQPGIKEVISFLNNIDLEFTINIIDQLVKEQTGKELQDSVKKSLLGVNEILQKIHNELNSIKKSIELHNTKYLNYYRSFVCDLNIDVLGKHNNILKHRYNILFELLKIYNNEK